MRIVKKEVTMRRERDSLCEYGEVGFGDGLAKPRAHRLMVHLETIKALESGSEVGIMVQTDTTPLSPSAEDTGNDPMQEVVFPKYDLESVMALCVYVRLHNELEDQAERLSHQYYHGGSQETDLDNAISASNGVLGRKYRLAANHHKPVRMRSSDLNE
jgi:hypothetical protein